MVRATQANPAIQAANPVNQEVRAALQSVAKNTVNVVIAPALPVARPPVSNPVAHLARALTNKALAIEAVVGPTPATNSLTAQAAVKRVNQEVRVAPQIAAIKTLKAVAPALPAANRAVGPVLRAAVAHSRARRVLKAAVEANQVPRVLLN